MATPLFSFGAIADTQYADIDDRPSSQQTKMRYYRNSLVQLKTAIADWTAEERKVNYIFQLGDIIDGFNVDSNNSEHAMKLLLKIFESSRLPVYHVTGNHELYNFTQEEVADWIGVEYNGAKSCFYSVPLHPGYRLIALNTYDVTTLGYRKTHEKYIAAYRLLSSVNTNEDKNFANGLFGLDKRFVEYNASISQEQLKWLDEELGKAQDLKEKVIMIGHTPIYPGSGDSLNEGDIVWNYTDVLNTIYKHSDTVLMYLAGHAHKRAVQIDCGGVWHVTVKGVVEVPHNEEGHYTFHVYKDKIEVDDPDCNDNVVMLLN